VTAQELIAELQTHLPSELAESIVGQFVNLRTDVALQTLERSAPGKFVETVAQILQYLATGTYVTSFRGGELDQFLRGVESQHTSLPENLRIVLPRVARGMYTVRSKRGIVHKSAFDPNLVDLRHLYSAAQWILTEIVRDRLSMDIGRASRLIEFVQAPSTTLVEDFGDRRLVLREGTAEEELLTLLLHYYPSYTSTSQLNQDMDCRAKSTVRNAIADQRRQPPGQRGDPAQRVTHGDDP
jgi:hypothetical protein